MENAFTDGALVVFVLETRLFVIVHVSHCGSEMFTLSVADRASENLRVKVLILVVFAHVYFVVTLESERLE